MGALSELQLGLIALAAAFVLAVWIYNRWQESRQRGVAARMFGDRAGAGGDPLASGIAAQQSDAPGGRQRIEPVIGETVDAAPEIDQVPLELADPAIDFLVSLRPRDELAAPVFWEAQRRHLDAFADSLRWLAWHQGQWRRLNAHDAGNCSAFLGALQLADRSGPLGEAALAKLSGGAAQLADAIGAEVDAPSTAEALARARELDQFCASVDWRIVLNVVAGSGQDLDAAALRAALAAAGLEADADGVLHAVDAGGQTQFVVAGLGGSPLAADPGGAGLSLSIDVPLVADGVAAFDRLLEFSRALAAAQDLRLVDEQRQPLAEAALLAIRAKIAGFQEKMGAAEIPAGGRRALRLYA